MQCLRNTIKTKRSKMSCTWMGIKRVDSESPEIWKLFPHLDDSLTIDGILTPKLFSLEMYFPILPHCLLSVINPIPSSFIHDESDSSHVFFLSPNRQPGILQYYFCCSDISWRCVCMESIQSAWNWVDSLYPRICFNIYLVL